MRTPLLLTTAAVVLAIAATASAQSSRGDGESTTQAPPSMPGPSLGGGSPQDAFLGSVPSGDAVSEPLSLSLRDAIARGLEHNLGLLLSGESARAARGARLQALADLLPELTAHVSETQRKVNLEALGFTGFPGVPTIIGPFHVFDARAYLSQVILDFNAIYNARAGDAHQRAAELAYQDARGAVVLVVCNLYLQAITAGSRIEATRAEVETAAALHLRAVDLRSAGVVAGIDVLRAQVELQAERQRLIFFENELAKKKLLLARAIGLPVGQEFALVDTIPYAPLQALTVPEALESAYRERADFRRATAVVEAAEASRKAVRGKALPSVELNGDYGAIGPSLSSAKATFDLAVDLDIPIFQGRRVEGELLEAAARLEQRKAELEDLRSRIDYEIRSAFLDIRAAGEQVEVASSALGLAQQQIEQARDRFAAGLVSNIEVVQAQEAVAAANESYISSLYAFNSAKVSLARAMGVAESEVEGFLGGNP